MTIPAVPSIKNGCLMVRGGVILTQVPENVVVTPISHEAAFIGACSETPSARLVFQLGVLEFKMWWMIPSFGESGCDVPTETQMLLLEAREASEDSDVPVGISESKTGKTFYLVVLPVLDGNFRATLQGTTVNELEFCAESGDPNVQTYRVLEAVFMNSGDNPYKLMRNSIEYV
ncbi:Glycosyl hydrolase [Parasponia andersonii]|uniref:Glycosyl hydrolase n=1 Tax=Parasponia andersonii TaxID=3476 RepID=A0A2P5DGF1_PARAD|nr:Glycosyl hydrolase [Parasponia andersonii]